MGSRTAEIGTGSFRWDAGVAHGSLTCQPFYIFWTKVGLGELKINVDKQKLLFRVPSIQACFFKSPTQGTAQ